MKLFDWFRPNPGYGATIPSRLQAPADSIRHYVTALGAAGQPGIRQSLTLYDRNIESMISIRANPADIPDVPIGA